MTFLFTCETPEDVIPFHAETFLPDDLDELYKRFAVLSEMPDKILRPRLYRILPTSVVAVTYNLWWSNGAMAVDILDKFGNNLATLRKDMNMEEATL